MENTLKKTTTKFRAVGYVNELDLTRRQGEQVVYKDNKPTGKKVKCENLVGKVSLKLEDSVLTFPVFFSSKGFDGEEAKNWKMAMAMEKWNPAIGGDSSEDATLVSIEGELDSNDYVDKQNKVRSGVRFRIKSANTRVLSDEYHGLGINATAFVNRIKNEVYNDEETGRLVVELLFVTGKGAVYPFETVVEADMADAFEELYEVGQTGEFDIDYVVRHIGKQTNKPAFGRGSKTTIPSGFDVREYVIVGAGNPIEEPDELTYEDENGNEQEVETKWINPSTVKKALKIRKAMLEEMENNAGKSYSNQSSFADKKASAKQSVKSKTKEVEEDGWDALVDDDEDDIF